MLLVNFDCEVTSERIAQLITKNDMQVSAVLDFTYLIKQDVESDIFRIIRPNALDHDLSIHAKSITEYVNDISRLSTIKIQGGNQLRELTIEGLPLYWLTPISLKHAQLSAVKNFFYFLELAKEKKLDEFVESDIVLCLPSKEFYFGEILEERVTLYFHKKVKCICWEKQEVIYHNWGLFSFIKGTLKQYKTVRNKCVELSRNIVKGEDSRVSIITFPGSTWVEEQKYDYICKELHDYIGEKIKTDYLPFFGAADMVTKLDKWEQKWNSALLFHFPSSWASLKFAIRHYRLVKKIKKVKIIDRKDFFIDERIIKKELNDLLFLNHWKLFYYYWLKNYCKKGIKNNKTFIYQDEFYHGGRMISHAKKTSGNKFIKTLGLQHGFFFSGHTVYSIKDAETEGNNALPIPDNFVVWGKIFKDEFLKHNTLPDNYVVEAGNFKYDQIHSALVKKKDTERKVIKTVLWCVTLETDTMLMFDVLKDHLKELAESTKIIVRCHPLHNIKEVVKNLFETLNYRNYDYSVAQNIFDDIQDSDIMISSSASTTFIDGLIGNLPVINIVLPDYQIDNIELDNLYNVRTSKEFGSVLSSIRNFAGDPCDNYSKINASVKNWDLILKY